MIVCALNSLNIEAITIFDVCRILDILVWEYINPCRQINMNEHQRISTAIPQNWLLSYHARAHICHEYHELYLWRKICHVEKFQIYVKNLYKLWSFIEIYAVPFLNLCGEKSV